ncbi:MAG: hypothetical protein Q7W30_09655 [Coriobacteriia bacterium]|nr:hypothetical protein [Coriobacteriia bacterium]
MKKITAIVAVVLLAVSAFGLAGCSEWLKDPVEDANKAISAANKSLTKYSDSDERVQTLANELNAIAVSPDGATKALAITGKIRGEFDGQKSALGEARKSIASIKALKIKDEFKKYADLEVKAIDARIKIIEQGVLLYDEMDKVYTAIRDRKQNNAQTQQVLAKVDEISGQIALLTEAARTDAQKASDYFMKQQLGGK